MKKIGFTGTQRGMTTAQTLTVEELLVELSEHKAFEAHIGDCIGADEEFYAIATKLPHCKTIGHIPDIDTKRAFCQYDVTCPPRKYRVRNMQIVNASDVLIATPGEMHEERYSGTWMTIRMARKKGMPIMIAWPDGTWTGE